MTPLLIAALGLLMVATAFLSGLFGMAGGLILIGVLLTILPLPSAMVLHAITQMASNGWRAFLWRDHIRWRPVFDLSDRLRAGARRLVDHPLRAGQADRAAVARRDAVHGAADAESLKPNPDSIAQGTFYGFICMGLMLMTGVSGPLMDTFFLGGNFRPPRGGGDQGDLPGGEPFRKAGLLRRHHRPGRDARSGARGGGGRGLDARHHAGAAHPRGDERYAVPHLGEPADHHGCLLLHRLRKLAAAGPKFLT